MFILLDTYELWAIAQAQEPAMDVLDMYTALSSGCSSHLENLDEIALQQMNIRHVHVI